MNVEDTYNKLSAKKRAFIETYPKYRSVTDTAKAIGIHRTTVYDWQETDKVFLQILLALKKEIDDALLERVEAELEERALGTKPAKMSDILLMFLAKALAPDKYREKPSETRLIGDITVKMAIPPYADQIRVETEAPKQLKESDDAIQEQGKAEGSDTGSSEET